MKVVQIAEIREKAITKERQEQLDAKASSEILKNALGFLKMNDMPELKDLKEKMRLKVFELEKIGNGRR